MLTAAQRIQCSSSAFNSHQNQALAKILTNVPGVVYRAAPLSNSSISSNTLIDLINFSLDGKNCLSGVIIDLFASGQYTAPTAASGDVQPRLLVSGISGGFGLQPFPHLAPLQSSTGAPQAWQMQARIYIQPIVSSNVVPSLQSNLSGQPFYPQSNAGVITGELTFNMSTKTNASAASNNVGNQLDPTLSLVYKTQNPTPFALGQTLSIDLLCQVKGVQFTMDIGYAVAL